MQVKSGTHRPLIMLAVAWIMAFAMMAPIYCVPPMEHVLSQMLLLTHTQTILLYTAPLIMVAAVAIPAGRIADNIGIRKAAGIGAIIIVAGTLLRATAGSASSVLAFTFVYGVGLGWVFPNLPKLVSAWIPREKAGMAIGILATGILTGTALPLAITMPLVFPVTNTFQGVFLIWAIPTIVAAILWWRLVKDPLLSPDETVTRKTVTRTNISFATVLRNKHLWLVAVLFLLHDFYFGTWVAWTPTLMILKGATPELSGLIASLTIWVGIPTVFFMPRLAYKLGVRKPFLWAPGIALAVTAWVALEVNLPMSWLLMAVVGFALETRFVTIIALPVEIMPKEEVGAASGLVLSIGFIGGIIGSLAGGRILDFAGNLDMALLLLIGVSIAATIIALKLPETGPQSKPRSEHRLPVAPVKDRR